VLTQPLHVTIDQNQIAEVTDWLVPAEAIVSAHRLSDGSFPNEAAYMCEGGEDQLDLRIDVGEEDSTGADETAAVSTTAPPGASQQQQESGIPQDDNEQDNSTNVDGNDDGDDDGTQVKKESDEESIDEFKDLPEESDVDVKQERDDEF
jgi:hypothetical protein